MFDISMLNPAVVGVPISAGFAGLGVSGWHRHQKAQAARRAAATAALEHERVRREDVLRQSAGLRSDTELWQRGHGMGQLAIAAVGTAAANLLPDLLRRFVAASAETFVSSPFLAEPDALTRSATLASLPSAFTDCTLPLELPLLPGGLKGATVAEGMALERYWMADVQERIDTWLLGIRRAAKTVALMLVVSPGGSACLGLPILQRFKEEYEQADAYVVVVLDHKTERREINLPVLFDLYSQTSSVKGFLVLDNRRSSEQFDRAVSLLLPAMITAPWIDTKPTSAFNVLPDVFRTHTVATLRTWVGWLPVRYEPAVHGTLPEVYYTDLSFAQAQAIRGITQVLHESSLQSLPLPAAKRPQFVYVIAPIRPDPDFRTLSERVRSSPISGLTYDTTLSFASIGEPLTPASQQAPLTVVSLLPIEGGIEAVTQLSLGHGAADLPVESLPVLTPVGNLTQPLVNGHEGE